MITDIWQFCFLRFGNLELCTDSKNTYDMVIADVPRGASDRVLNEAIAIRQAAEDGEIQQLLKIKGETMPADPLTKPMSMSPLRQVRPDNRVSVVVEQMRNFNRKDYSRSEDFFWLFNDDEWFGPALRDNF